MGVRDDFRAFLEQGNLVQLAVAFVMGLAFGAVVTALVTDLINPLIGWPGNANLSLYTYSPPGSHVTFLWGAFLTALLAFVVIAIVVFFAIALPYARYQAYKKARAAATTKDCPECLSAIPVKAKRCAFCASPVA
jgi:large conductance mechanosensitive channel